MMLLEDKVAVIHGGGGSIGAAAARVFAREGARLYLAGRSLGSVLYGVGPVDPLAYGAGAGLLLTVGLIAAYLPALRASRIEPMRAIGG